MHEADLALDTVAERFEDEIQRMLAEAEKQLVLEATPPEPEMPPKATK